MTHGSTCKRFVHAGPPAKWDGSPVVAHSMTFHPAAYLTTHVFHAEIGKWEWIAGRTDERDG